MTIEEYTDFPIGYFYIISKLNGFVLDVFEGENGAAGSHIITSPKKDKSPERDTQLWMHQDGFLTNKACGLVLDVDKAGTFKAIFTGEQRLFLDTMKDSDNADDQKFGYDGQYIFLTSDPNQVVDIRKAEVEAGAKLIIYKRREETDLNQQWSLQLGDPPKVVNPEDEENGKSERLQAWFGNWFGWGDKKKTVLKEKELTEAHEKVYKQKKEHHYGKQLIAGAVAYQAVKMWEKRKEENGEEFEHGTIKKVVASIAAAELVKVIADRGDDTDSDDEDDDKKRGLMESMATSAAMNLIESKYGFN
ncbi:unnamed protein product [Cunninghamella blakesleeana]